MPTYEYVCEKCGNPFSLFLTYAEYDRAEVKCPGCGSDAVRRERLGEEAAGNNSSQMLGKVMRTVQEQSGRELPPDTNEALTRLERGESPESINKDYE